MNDPKILPGTGRGTVRRTVEGAHLSAISKLTAGAAVQMPRNNMPSFVWGGAPSPMLRMVPLPVPGRD